MGSPEVFWDDAQKHIPETHQRHANTYPQGWYDPDKTFSADDEIDDGHGVNEDNLTDDTIDSLADIEDSLGTLRPISPDLLRELENKDPIPGEHIRSITAVVRRTGIDAIAFYKSIRKAHQKPFPGKWGIFYTEQGIHYIAYLLNVTIPTTGVLPVVDTTTQWAYQFLQAHERYHYCFDMYAMSIEAAAARSMYLPLKIAYKHCRHRQVEEAIANNAAWGWSKRLASRMKRAGHTAEATASRAFAEDLMTNQRGAYAHYAKPRDHLNAILAANLVDGDYSGRPSRPDLGPWVSTLPRRLSALTSCPEYLFTTSQPGLLSSPYKLPIVTGVHESSRFNKQLEGRYEELRVPWETTKKKLIEQPCLPGLDFKRWGSTGNTWSVRVTRKVRAHLTPTDPSSGLWQAQDIGSHKAMGHG
jgi:hypothetical protein